MILRLTLEYDGTGYRGWARQPGQPTIEGVVRDALDAVYPRWDALAVAGRTDTGVHAVGQVVSVEVEGGPPAERAPEALNTALPDDVAVLACGRSAARFSRALLGAGPLLSLRRARSRRATGSRGAAGALVATARRRRRPVGCRPSRAR